ncbi:MAG: hypothetical protein AAFO77_11080 [Pseudomonadota bacterium]
MAANADFYVMAMLHYAITIAMCLAGIVVYWHLQRIRKPGMARFFWFLAFGYALALLWRPIMAAIVEPSVFRFVLGIVSVCVLAAYAAAWSRNPLEPKRYSYEDEEDDDDGAADRV